MGGATFTGAPDDPILDVIAKAGQLPSWIATRILAALRDAGYDVVDVSDDRHQIEFRDDGWTIAHPVKERLDGSLFDCRLNWDGDDPGLRGRYELGNNGVVVLPYGGEECE